MEEARGDGMKRYGNPESMHNSADGGKIIYEGLDSNIRRVYKQIKQDCLLAHKLLSDLEPSMICESHTVIGRIPHQTEN